VARLAAQIVEALAGARGQVAERVRPAGAVVDAHAALAVGIFVEAGRAAGVAHADAGAHRRRVLVVGGAAVVFGAGAVADGVVADAGLGVGRERVPAGAAAVAAALAHAPLAAVVDRAALVGGADALLGLIVELVAVRAVGVERGARAARGEHDDEEQTFLHDLIA